MDHSPENPSESRNASAAEAGGRQPSGSGLPEGLRPPASAAAGRQPSGSGSPEGLRPAASSRNASDSTDPVGQLLQLWQQGQQPEVRSFLARLGGDLSPTQVAAIVRIDQRERWTRGERIQAEVYLRDFPEVRADESAALDAIYGEYLLREELGEAPTLEEYVQRFPQYAERLRTQIECRLAFTNNFLAGAFVPPREEKPVPTVDSPAAREAPAENQEGGPENLPATVIVRPVEPQPSHRYVIRKFHARGGIGEVWLAEDAEIGREVALKRLKPNHEDARDRFLAEAQVTGQLEHPGIVPVHDLGLDDEGQPFYIMTFIRGRTLKDAIADYHADSAPVRGGRAGTEPTEVHLCRLLEVFIRVCQATAYAHSRGVIHRDLKPDNVMLGEYGETLVLDWGMAKVQSQPDPPDSSAASSGSPPAVHLSPSGETPQTQAGQVMGTPSYMSPEMAAGRAADADERTDVYLLGATLYHILTGQLPRRGSSFNELVDLACTVPPPPPRQLKADVPRALDAICQKAMAHRAQDRYGSALELADDVQRYLAGAPVSAYREPILARAWRWCKRHRRLLGRSLAGAAFLGLAVAAFVGIQEARGKAVAARQEAERFRRAEEVRGLLKDFRDRLDERQFYTVLTTPADEQRLHYDSNRGEQAGAAALALADRLTEEFQQLSTPGERAAFEHELHDLLLLLVQARSRQSPGPQTVREELLGRLERAVALRGPSQGFHRLRVRCYRLLGEQRLAEEEEQRAEAPDLAATPLDHFLLAEQYRLEAVVAADAQEGPSNARPNAGLLRQAVEQYQKGLRLDPRHFWSYFQLGRCYLSLGLGSEAVEGAGYVRGPAAGPALGLHLARADSRPGPPLCGRRGGPEQGPGTGAGLSPGAAQPRHPGLAASEIRQRPGRFRQGPGAARGEAVDRSRLLPRPVAPGTGPPFPQASPGRPRPRRDRQPRFSSGLSHSCPGPFSFGPKRVGSGGPDHVCQAGSAGAVRHEQCRSVRVAWPAAASAGSELGPGACRRARRAGAGSCPVDPGHSAGEARAGPVR